MLPKAIIMHPAIMEFIPGDFVPVSLTDFFITSTMDATIHAKKAYGMAMDHPTLYMKTVPASV